MAKLCPKGKAAAKRKFKVYPSAYANMYASGVCSGKITPGGKKRVKKFKGGPVKEDSSKTKAKKKPSASVKKQPEKYRKLVKDRLNEQAKKIHQKKADSFAKKYGGKGGPKITSKDKEALRFIKRVEARDATGKNSHIDYLAKKVKEKEESPANVERGMGKGYNKGGIVRGCGRVMSNRRKKTKYI